LKLIPLHLRMYQYFSSRILILTKMPFKLKESGRDWLR
jgi:hypothetical protein